MQYKYWTAFQECSSNTLRGVDGGGNHLCKHVQCTRLTIALTTITNGRSFRRSIPFSHIYEAW